MTLAYWVNGERDGAVSPFDRGLHYGDGLFETMRVVDGRIRLLDQHLGRLGAGCERLAIARPPAALLLAELHEAARIPTAGVVKLIVTRGSGGRGYRAPESPATTRWIAAYPPPDHAALWAQHGVDVRFCTTVLSEQPALAGLKHLNRLEQVCARNEWSGAKPQEGLMLDAHGRVVCGTMSNLFAIRGGIWATPRIDRCGVAGTMRATILQAARAAGKTCVEVDLDRSDVEDADELFLTNAVVGAWPVRSLEGLPSGAPGAVRLAQGWIRSLS